MTTNPTVLDFARLRVLVPVVSILGLAGTVGVGAWTLRGMHADIKGEIREQSIVNNTRWKAVDEKLSDITVRVQTLLNDHQGFVTTRDMRAYMRQLQEMNFDVQRTSGSGLKVPEVE